MPQYCAYSDEAGTYARFPSAKHLATHPYYVRGSVIVRSSDWPVINSALRSAKTARSIDPSNEVKWTHLQTALGILSSGNTLDPTKDYGYLAHLTERRIENLRDTLLDTLRLLENPKVIFTVTDHALIKSYGNDTILKWHLQDTMQRIQMEVAGPDNLCYLFLDRISNAHDKKIREVYNGLFEAGDLVKYTSIHDCASVVDSKHSAGIQLADLVTGTFLSRLRGLPLGAACFAAFVQPFLRTNGTGDPYGYGIVTVPKSIAGNRTTHRNAITTRLA